MQKERLAIDINKLIQDNANDIVEESIESIQGLVMDEDFECMQKLLKEVIGMAMRRGFEMAVEGYVEFTELILKNLEGDCK